jgi:hypothetical protein
LNLQVAFHLACAVVIFTDSEKQFALDSLVGAKLRIGPLRGVHILGYRLLQGLENFLVGIRHLRGIDFNFAIQFLGMYSNTKPSNRKAEENT